MDSISTRPRRNSMSGQKKRKNSVTPATQRRNSTSSRGRRNSSSSTRGRPRTVRPVIDEHDSDKDLSSIMEISNSSLAEQAESSSPSQSRTVDTRSKSKRRRTKIPHSDDDEYAGQAHNNSTDKFRGPSDTSATPARVKVKRRNNKDSNNTNINDIKPRLNRRKSNNSNNKEGNLKKNRKRFLSEAESLDSLSDNDASKEQRNGRFTDDEQGSEFEAESKTKLNMVDLFGGKLTPEQADTSRTRPDQKDKLMFENAKIQAESVMNINNAHPFPISCRERFKNYELIIIYSVVDVAKERNRLGD